MKNTLLVGIVVGLLTGAASANANFFGGRITSINPGMDNWFEIQVDNSHFQDQNCFPFKMGKFETNDLKKLERTYSAVLAAMAAQQDVVIWLNDSNPCHIDTIFVNRR